MGQGWGKKCQKTIQEPQVFHEESNLRQFIAGSVFCKDMFSVTYVWTPQLSSKTDLMSSTNEVFLEAHCIPPLSSIFPRTLTPLHSPHPTAHSSTQNTKAACLMCATHTKTMTQMLLIKHLSFWKEERIYNYKTNHKIKYRKCTEISCMPTKEELIDSVVPESSSLIKFLLILSKDVPKENLLSLKKKQETKSISIEKISLYLRLHLSSLRGLLISLFSN